MVGKIFLGVLLALLVLLLAAVVFFFLFAHRRRPPKPEAPSQMGPVWRAYLTQIEEGRVWLSQQPAQRVSITSFDGLTLRGLYLPAEEPRACVLLFHGYRSTGLRDFAPLLPFYHANHISFLLVDQRACGESEGKYITFGIHERRDAAAWADYMDRRLGGGTPLVLEGLSLGAATVMMAAGQPLPGTVRGIIADCGFTSPWDIIAHCARQQFHIPLFPMLYLLSGFTRLAAGFGYRDCSTLDTLSRSHLPLLLIHGGADDYVPTYMTEQNYAAAAGPKRKVIVPGAGHAVSYLLQPQLCQRELLSFLDGILTEDASWPTKS